MDVRAEPPWMGSRRSWQALPPVEPPTTTARTFMNNAGEYLLLPSRDPQGTRKKPSPSSLQTRIRAARLVSALLDHAYQALLRGRRHQRAVAGEETPVGKSASA